ncbi:Zinc finger, RING/FYVE/PHD-type [Artemisia annua]|uniref:Zinc finger, RING/FYVE/PHD-type n=1 Tax=Artemisia annua TaxID=35608 RepID=A0A2U1P7H7_ARTAN|nr:Zinc finger, RING/FYVE/PHD-type [Artemisia annua]
MARRFVILISTAFSTYLTWALDAFFRRSISYKVPMKSGLELKRSWFSKNSSSNELEECAVCLHVIEVDDEIRELRCKHLFHKDCLDRCVEHKHTTCPLCRDYLAGPRMVCELGWEMIVFSFCNTNRLDDDDYSRWWLR